MPSGGLVYCDGANLNALLGIARPGDMGIDAMHFNLHKTFATPHGGGGPGSGPVGVTEELAPFLPVPLVARENDAFRLDYDRPHSVGRVKAFLRQLRHPGACLGLHPLDGAAGLRHATEMAVLNANYVRARLEGTWHLPYVRRSMHEVVFSDRDLGGDCHTLDVAKRLIDYGYHPPTIYFPLVVKGAIMIEPTETECVGGARRVLRRHAGNRQGGAGEPRPAAPGAAQDPYPPVRRDGGGAQSAAEMGRTGNKSS
jgi:glycine dehydrogenase subunit 2